MTDASPSQIGKYQIVSIVGEGAMGTVYRAIDTVIGRTVAIKVMNAAIARDANHRQRFLREAQAAGSLQHPNVVTIYDLGEIDGHLFIAMEFLHGADLEKLMLSPEPVKLQTKLDIIIDVLMGLSYAHKHGITHRDIKPANIRVGEDGKAKIMDFGVAHLASSDMTRTGLVVGTPSYMAPEQVTGGKTVAGTDIFAVGAVLYHLLTGTKPFEAPTLQSLFYRIVTDMPQPLDQVRPGLPPALNGIVQKAMAKEPADRYASALDMANDIIGVRAGLSGNPYASTASLTMSAVAPAPPAPPEVVLPPSSAWKRFGVPAAAAAVAVLALTVFALNKSGDDEPAELAVVDSSAITGSADVPAATPPAESVAPPPPAPPPAPPPPAPAPVMAEEKKEELRRPTAREQRKAAPPAKKAAPPAPRVSREEQKTRPVPPPQVRPAPPPPAPVFIPPPVRDTQPRQVVVNPPAPPPAPPPVVRAPDPQPARPAPNPRDEIASAVAAYARAIESRDIGAVRRAYPGLTSDQARGFEQFFQSARSINVTFRVTDVEVSGTSADARLSGTYEYVNSEGRTERQPVNFGASLRHDGSAWRLRSVR